MTEAQARSEAVSLFGSSGDAFEEGGVKVVGLRVRGGRWVAKGRGATWRAAVIAAQMSDERERQRMWMLKR